MRTAKHFPHFTAGGFDSMTGLLNQMILYHKIVWEEKIEVYLWSTESVQPIVVRRGELRLLNAARTGIVSAQRYAVNASAIIPGPMRGGRASNLLRGTAHCVRFAMAYALLFIRLQLRNRSSNQFS